jgi:hypothetical protein
MPARRPVLKIPQTGTVGSTLRESMQRGFLREAALVAFAILAYFSIRNATVGNAGEAFVNGERIVDFEQWLGVDWENGIQDSVVGSDFLVMLTNWVYIWGHWPVILGAATLLYVHRRERYYVLRNALFVSGAIGFLFFAFFPVAPPRLLEVGLVDTVSDQSSSYRALQPPGLTNQYAAFPSLHVGWNVLVGIVLFLTATHLAVRLFAVALPLAMAFAVVATANHFVVDIAAGVVVVLMGLVAARTIERRPRLATLANGGSAARLEPQRRRAASIPRRAPRGQPPRRPARS